MNKLESRIRVIKTEPSDGLIPLTELDTKTFAKSIYPV